ncbi:hypothetical protein DLD77_09540 [Chitinophaga alhagiae]|uniref:Novel toxin 16 domain-containing protein n=1 Tax=Chitinophaga alhagiae TaxID=2203219 RepID=A0ABN5LRD0_9BACT|nr:hypothetical protein DLD77_09540 [Chitinophaga alhagiae]
MGNVAARRFKGHCTRGDASKGWGTLLHGGSKGIAQGGMPQKDGERCCTEVQRALHKGGCLKKMGNVDARRLKGHCTRGDASKRWGTLMHGGSKGIAQGVMPQKGS